MRFHKVMLEFPFLVEVGLQVTQLPMVITDNVDL